MIDLDILAESRANKLGQDQKAWRDAVWTEAFQKLSQTLTDGEVESFFESCRTVGHFQILTKYLMDGGAANGITYSQLMTQVARSGYQMEEWVDSIVEITQWASSHQRTFSLLEILMAINHSATRAAPNASPLVAAVQEDIQSGQLDRK